MHPAVNLYTKDDKKAYARINREKKLNIDVPQCRVEPVTTELAERLHLDTKFYKKHVDSNGIHILSSGQVPDSVLVQAHKTIYCMTSMLPREVLDAMTRVNTRVVVMGQKEVTINVPEHSGMARDRSLNWNLRARGLGGTLHEPITSCAEENIMAYPWDKYHAEDILIHEFSHSIHLIGILQVDPTINQQLKDLLAKARAAGKWDNTYAGTEYAEYWAEGVQNWFNVNAETPKSDTKHNQVNTREEMQRYDPGLYALIAKYFPETNAQIGKHKKENLYNYK
jgi:alpha-glucosidase